jgi:hypothetical protein
VGALLTYGGVSLFVVVFAITCIKTATVFVVIGVYYLTGIV